MSLRTPWAKALDRLLADGDWHARSELIDALAPLVPPGRAYRRGERPRAKRRGRDQAAPTSRTHGCQLPAITLGSRHTIAATIRGGLRSGRFAQNAYGDIRQAR